MAVGSDDGYGGWVGRRDARMGENVARTPRRTGCAVGARRDPRRRVRRSARGRARRLGLPQRQRRRHVRAARRAAVPRGRVRHPRLGQPVRLRARRSAVRGRRLQPHRHRQPGRRADRAGRRRHGWPCSSSTCSAAGSPARARGWWRPGSPRSIRRRSSTPRCCPASRSPSSPSPAPCWPSCGRPTRAARRGRGRCPGCCSALTAFLRPEYLVLTALLAAAGRRARRPARGAVAGRRCGRPDGARLRRHDRAVDGDRLDRPRALRAGLDRRREGALHRHLPARRRPARPHQAASVPPLPRHRPAAGPSCGGSR